MKLLKFTIFFLLLSTASFAQKDSTPFLKWTLKVNRDKEYTNIQKAITRKLSQPLNDTTEQEWMDAFYSIELTRYKQAWVNAKIKLAFDAKGRSDDFNKTLMELVFANYTTEFKSNVDKLLQATKNVKVFAMCAEYLLRIDKSKKNNEKIAALAFKKTDQYFEEDPISSFIAFELLWPIMQIAEEGKEKEKMKPSLLLNKNFLTNNVVMYSIQRKNRNYPGIVIVRNKEGNFIKNDSGRLFFVPQLARSMSNLPSYLSNGNTPQGIFRMDGFDTSKSAAIGPTTNIQLMMPSETSIQYFLKDSSITDTVWTQELYGQLLPKGLKKYHPIYQSFYAGLCGRTEIIAHGTTVNPEYYKGQPYYPHTPTEGCLATKEIWSSATGKLTESNQQKLVNAVKAAGGANGYCIVIEIDDQQKPVTLEEILPLIK